MSSSSETNAVEVAAAASLGLVANYFGEVDLGHKSRNRCFARVAQQISRHPGGTLPDKLGQPAASMAMARLLNRPEATAASVLGPHESQVGWFSWLADALAWLAETGKHGRRRSDRTPAPPENSCRKIRLYSPGSPNEDTTRKGARPPRSPAARG